MAENSWHEAQQEGPERLGLAMEGVHQTDPIAKGAVSCTKLIFSR